jgi:mannose-6-phosphate isomerase-like protein (cupin superfamily)
MAKNKITHKNVKPPDFFLRVEKDSVANKNFREVVWTGKHLQVVLMSLEPREELGWEVHPHTDQFFRIEKGRALLRTRMESGWEVTSYGQAGDALLVPAGIWHNVINDSDTRQAKLYTIYAPPHHPANRVQRVKPAGD